MVWVIDCDASTIQIAQAQSNTPASEAEPTFEYIQSDAEKPDLILDIANKLPITSINNMPVVTPFTHSICMFNTIFNIEHFRTVYHQMLRLLGDGGAVILSVYSEHSTDVRAQWYEAIGEGKATVHDHFIKTESGFTSAHIAKKDIEKTFGHMEVIPCTDMGYILVKQV